MAETFTPIGETTDAARAGLLQLQEEYGRPTRPGGWTSEQHAAWDAQWAHWRKLVFAKHRWTLPWETGPEG